MSLFSVVSYRTELRKVSKFKSDWHISNFCGGGCFFSRWLDIRVVSSLSLSQAISVTIVYQFEKQCSFMVSFYGGIKLQVDIYIYICLEKGFFLCCCISLSKVYRQRRRRHIMQLQTIYIIYITYTLAIFILCFQPQIKDTLVYIFSSLYSCCLFVK